MLKVEHINTYYWQSHVLWDVSLEVPHGSIVAILGRNGMGKTTIIRSITGLTPPRDGAVRFKDQLISGLEPFRIAKKGISLVPQGRMVFPSLTVKENLLVGARETRNGDSWNLDKVYDLFPILKERQRFHANLLSGGEQSMLAVARSLMTNPDLLIMDEPSEGLAPRVIKQIGDTISALKGQLTVFLAEQNFNMAMSVADYVYIVSNGKIVWEGKPESLQNDEETKQSCLGV
ncbi:MAG TPA: ABC transporter ATP-binding protein [Thermoleophilia bacterium]|nr:ABC transporter ATP-binding protein [Thermoleophilia bacterium]